MEDVTSTESSSAESFSADASFPLSSRYGLNAWRRWTASSAAQSSDTEEKSACKEGEKSVTTWS